MIDSPQILELNDSEFRLLISLWCLASEADNGGEINYSISALRRRILPDRTNEEIQSMLNHLIQLDLLSGEENHYVIPRWKKLQYSTDDKTSYQRLYRERRKNEKQMKNECKTNVKQMQNECKPVVKRASVYTDTDTESDTDTDINNPITSSKEDAPAKSPKKSSQPYMNHPAVMIYRGVMQLTPKPVLRELIAQKIGDEPEALDRWREVCIEWLARAYNPKNIDGLLDFYQNGGKKMPKMSKTAAAYMALAEKFEREEKGG
jgi:hypothetical protein